MADSESGPSESRRLEQIELDEVSARLVEAGRSLEDERERTRALEQDVALLSAQITALTAELGARDDQLASLRNTRSWRFTLPMRLALITVRHFTRILRSLSRMGRSLLAGDRMAAAQALSDAAGHVPHRFRFAIPPAVRSTIRSLILPQGSSGAVSMVSEPAVEAPAPPPARDMYSSSYDDRRPYVPLTLDQYATMIDNYRRDRDRFPARRIAVVTAIVGNYDSRKLYEELDPEIDYHLVTDGLHDSLGFQYVHRLDYFDIDPTRQSRWVKLHPHRHLSGYDTVIWIDANVIIRGDLKPLIARLRASGRPLAIFSHPVRTSVHDEAAECIRLGKDDAVVIEMVAARYREEGFDCTDLPECNALLFDMRHPGLVPLLTEWWRLLDSGSRRDQLSVNYALKLSGQSYLRLSERPDSLRNHPDFAVLPHDRGAGVMTPIVSALATTSLPPLPPPVPPIPPASASGLSTVEVVVCVHNALDDVKACLQSLQATRGRLPFSIFVIDDGSNAETAAYLRGAADMMGFDLSRHETAQGYTRSANEGLLHSRADVVILLNSDTVVTRSWVDKLVAAMHARPGVGIVGPLSNAASYQSLPTWQGSEKQTAVNALPPGYSPDDMSDFCAREAGDDILALTPLVHGFCFAIRREVIDAIGGFDVDRFPTGYGEEDDYCLRAIDAGFDLGVALNTYVWHAKSMSFGTEARAQLAAAGNRVLLETFGTTRLARYVASMQHHPRLEYIRDKAGALY